MQKKFNLFERIFLICGAVLNIATFIITRSTTLSLIQSMLSIFNAVYTAKGSFIGYICLLVEGSIYSYISFMHKYYSEVIITMGINIPMALWGLITWLRHQDKKTEAVEVTSLSNKEIVLAILSQVLCSFFYYWLLRQFNTDMLMVSTISMCVNVLAMYFSAKRSVLVFWSYMVNCLIRISLWTIPALNGDFSNFPIVISCAMYFICDIYGIITWNRLEKKQNARD